MKYFDWLASTWQLLFSTDCHFCHGTGTWVPGPSLPSLQPGPCAHCQGTGRVWTI